MGLSYIHLLALKVATGYTFILEMDLKQKHIKIPIQVFQYFKNICVQFPEKIVPGFTHDYFNSFRSVFQRK